MNYREIHFIATPAWVSVNGVWIALRKQALCARRSEGDLSYKPTLHAGRHAVRFPQSFYRTISGMP